MNFKKLFLSLTLLTFSFQVKAADLWTLLGNGDTTLPGGDVVYVLRGAGNVSVQVGVTFGQLKGEGYVSLTANAFKFSGDLNSSEIRLFAGEIIKLSNECFNIDQARGNAIQTWLLSNDAREESIYYTAGTHFAEKMFGPLKLSLEKRSNRQGHSVAVYFSRTGTPGQFPWIKSCIASG